MNNLAQAIAGLDAKKRELLALLARQKGIDAGRAAPGGIPRLPREPGASHPCSFAQERLWFLSRLRPGDPSYNLPMVRNLRGAIRPGTLRRALAGLVERHEALRTRFGESRGRPFQVVDPPESAAALELPVVDLAALPEDRLQEGWNAVYAAFAYRPFDLARGPLCRPALVRLLPDFHRLLVNLHHVVSDGWSADILARELVGLYDAAAAAAEDGTGSAGLPALPVQYADFAAWQRQTLQGEALERLLGYWRGRLAGAPVSLELPADHARPAVRTSRGRRIRFFLPPAAAAGLGALGRRLGTTLFMVLLAAYAALLRRLSGGEDLCIGTPVAGRTRRELEPVVGLFINSLVMRCDLAGDPSFEELLARVQPMAVEAYAHQELPLEKLVEDLRPERALNRGPLFQVMFTLQNTPEQAGFQAGVAREEGRIGERPLADYDLGLTCYEAGDRLGVIVEASADLFEPVSLRRFQGWIETLFPAVAADPRRPLSALPLLPEAQRHQLTVEWNDTAQPALKKEPETSIHGLFAAVAAGNPGAVALVESADGADGRIWTYGELDAAADRRARELRLLGVDLETPVAVCLERSAGLIVALLAVLKAGGAYVPLDPGAPPRRLLQLLEQTGAPVLIAEERLLDWSPPFGIQTLLLDTESPAPPAVPLPEVGGGDSLAYVLFTSGSTGEPKGVAVPHRAVVRLVRETGYARLGPEETFLQMAPAAFDASTLEIWGPLLNGGRLVLMPPGAASLEQIGQAVRRHGVTTLWLTAGLFHQMVEEQLDALRGLRQLLAGGDTLSPAHVERAVDDFAENGGPTLINGYGPTENTTFTCCHPCAFLHGGGPVPVGRPIAGTRVRVLGRLEHGLPALPAAAAGAEGELCAAGDGLARGYLGRPDLTAERFVPDPSPVTPAGGERLYRTGDLARARPDGRFEHLGRLDRQVKVRGYRIEPAEIEAALTDLSAVREAAVLVREDRPGDRRLVAFVVPRDAGDPGTAELRATLAERLPDFMVPAAFVTLESLPLTPNGKVDRAALAGLEVGGPESGAGAASCVAPRTPAEEVLAALWAELLGKERVGIRDDFFDLGGHSLLATQLLSRVRSLFGVEVDLGAVFTSPTVEGLAAWIERADSGREPAPPIVPVPRDETGLPLSFAQQRLWFLDRLIPDSPAYNVPAALRLAGSLGAREQAALEASFNAVAARHEVLRTTFHPGEREPVQRIAPPSFRPLPLVDLSGLPDPDGPARGLAAAEAARPFDLEAGPVVRWTLLRLRPDEHAVLFTLHHIASDGWSIGVLTAELAALYASFLEGGPAVLPPLPVQYADFAVWQRRWLQGEVLDAQLRFWRERLAGAPPVLELPADRPRPPMPTGRGGIRPAHLPEALAGRLAALARKEGATLFMVLLAGWTALLRRLTGQTDVLVGTPVANRNRQETEGLIGFFVNTLVLRADLADGPSFRDLAVRLRGETLAAFAHQDLPFERLVEELAPERNLSHTPLFQVMLALQNATATATSSTAGPGTGFSLPGLRLLPFNLMGGGGAEEEDRAVKLDLYLSLTETGGGLAGSLEYSRDLFDGATVGRWLNGFATLLAAAAEEPERAISTLPLLSPDERRQLLAIGNTTDLPTGADACLHELFEAQVDRTPDAPALVDGATGETWTYAELERQANRLAWRLRGLGVGPEVAVGVLAGRTPATVAALLAVLKAGGAYVPLDPAYPAERLAWLLQDARVAVLVTDRLPEQDGPPVLLLGSEQDAPEDRLPPLAVPDNLAYVIYTSGSTGRPKGVAVRHRGGAARMAWAREAFPAEDLAAVLASTSFSFDLSVFELFAPLTRGGAAVLAENALHLPALRTPVTLVNTVPSALAELLRAGSLPPAVRTVCLAGEALPEALAARLLSFADSPRLFNLYGPSEDTTYSTGAAVSPQQPGPPPIGLPLPGTRAYVLDEDGEPVPLGVAGELYLGGAGLARGYLRRPDLTAERFLPDPFGPPGGRLYRTGDRVRRLPAGDLEFLGRLDSQVKVRGFRIEPGEIEAVLLRHPGVRQAAVAVRTGPDGQPRLVAFLAAKTDVVSFSDKY